MEAESEEEDDDDDDDGKKVSGDITQSWASVIFSRRHLSPLVFRCVVFCSSRHA